MTEHGSISGGPGFLARDRLQALIDGILAAGYACLGPKVRDGAILYEPLDNAAELPVGARDRQIPGQYRLERGDGPRCFAWATGPQALKPHLFAPREVLWRAERGPDGRIVFSDPQAGVKPVALFGARACDLAALHLQDRHFLEGPYPDPHYAARRRKLLVVAVNCSHPAQTCFCASTGDGPHASAGYDLALTEFDDGFVIHAGSATGARLVEPLRLSAATPAQREAQARQAEQAAQSQSRSLPSRNLRSALFANLEHPRWSDVAERCLSCGNCTSVCPTCFCHSEAEELDLGGARSEHVRQWDSCFTAGHGYMNGHQVRPDTRTRYRQWLTHKLGGWHDQYGRSGCVGCGRCIAWCPAEIDLTEEAAAICGASA